MLKLHFKRLFIYQYFIAVVSIVLWYWFRPWILNG